MSEVKSITICIDFDDHEVIEMSIEEARNMYTMLGKALGYDIPHIPWWPDYPTTPLDHWKVTYSDNTRIISNGNVQD